LFCFINTDVTSTVVFNFAYFVISSWHENEESNNYIFWADGRAEGPFLWFYRI